MTKTINTTELRALLQGKTEFLLVDVLARDKFVQDHIEGALNVPMDSPDSLKTIERAAGDKKKKIVAYCGKSPCHSSKRVARLLVEAGHTDVLCYEGGVARWREEGGKSGTVQANKAPVTGATKVEPPKMATAEGGGLAAKAGAGADCGSAKGSGCGTAPVVRETTDAKGQAQKQRTTK